MFRYVEAMWPLWFYVQVADPSEEGLTAHFDYLSSRMQARRQAPRDRRLAYVIQISPACFRQANAQERSLIANWMQRDFKLMQDTAVGVGFVMNGALLRGALTAVFWLARTPVPYRVHGTLDQALSVAMTELDNQGLRAPSLGRLPVHLLADEVQRVIGSV